MCKSSPKLQAFYDHPLIKRLSNIPRWTVSNKDKAPADMYELINRRIFVGCDPKRKASMMTLTEIQQAFATFKLDPPNHAFRIDSLLDHILVFDVEKTCPIDLRRKFLEIPRLYGEISSSGKGLHIITEIPDSLKGNMDLLNRTVLKRPEGFYEILIANHFVTFTHNQIDPQDDPPSNDDLTIELVNNLLEKANKPTVLSTPDNKSAKLVPIEKIPNADEIIEQVIENFKYKKTLKDMGGDTSRWEFGNISHALWVLKRIIRELNSTEPYSDPQVISLLYEISCKVIPHRAKHDTMRSNMPYLLYQCVVCFNLHL